MPTGSPDSPRAVPDGSYGVGLKRLCFHDLRHSFGTLAVQVFPLSDVKACMGQADIQMTMVHVHHGRAENAAERLSRVVQSTGDLLSTDAGRGNGSDPEASASHSAVRLDGRSQVSGGLLPRA